MRLDRSQSSCPRIVRRNFAALRPAVLFLLALCLVQGCGKSNATIDSLTLSPSAIELGSTFTAAWTSSNATDCSWTVTPATGGGDVSALTGTQSPTSPLSVKPTATGMFSYQLSCSKSGSPTATQAATVEVDPVLAFSLSASATTLAVGQLATLTWNSNGSTCRADGAWSGALSSSGTQTVTPTSAGTYTYSLQCVTKANPAPTAKSVTITVYDAASVTLTTGGPITVGSTVTVTWRANNAGNCVAGGTPLTGWAGGQTTSGAVTLQPSSPKDYTLLLTCTANGPSTPVAATANLAVNGTCPNIYSPAYYMGSKEAAWERNGGDLPLLPPQLRTVILNPESGITANTASGSLWFAQHKAIYDRVVAKGASVPGYIPMGLANSSGSFAMVDRAKVDSVLSEAKREVDLYGNSWGVSYYFLDEIYPQQTLNGIDLIVTLYQPIVDYITGKSANAQITLNPGVNVPEAFLNLKVPATTILRIVTFEDTLDNYINRYTAPTWAATHSNDRVVHIVHTGGASTTNWKTAMDLARQRGAGHFYFTEEIMPNPFTDIPRDWDLMTAYSRNGCR